MGYRPSSVGNDRYRGPMIELHLRGRVSFGRRADLETFRPEAVPFYQRPGGIRVRLRWDVADPDRFVEVVAYADQGAHDRDQARVDTVPQMHRGT